jgi:hypothetical protein
MRYTHLMTPPKATAGRSNTQHLRARSPFCIDEPADSVTQIFQKASSRVHAAILPSNANEIAVFGAEELKN